MNVFPMLNNSELESIANILGDTSNGFTGSEIGRLLLICQIQDDLPNGTKRIRLSHIIHRDLKTKFTATNYPDESDYH